MSGCEAAREVGARERRALETGPAYVARALRARARSGASVIPGITPMHGRWDRSVNAARCSPASRPAVGNRSQNRLMGRGSTTRQSVDRTDQLHRTRRRARFELLASVQDIPRPRPRRSSLLLQNGGRWEREESGERRIHPAFSSSTSSKPGQKSLGIRKDGIGHRCQFRRRYFHAS